MSGRARGRRPRAGLLLAALFALLPLDNYVACESVYQRIGNPSVDFSRHTVIKPKIYHGREKRSISTTREQEGNHIHDITIGYELDGREHVLDLRLNRELIPANFFVKYQSEGKHVVNKPTAKDVELCQYAGEIRDVKDSWAAISTCRGLRGVIFDGSQMHYIQSGNDDDLEAPHFLYQHKDLISNHTCGYDGGISKENHAHHSHGLHEDHIHDTDSFKLDKNYNEFNRILRHKRSTESEAKIRGPYNANKQSRYVELVIVVDNKEYRELGEDLNKVYHHCKDIANIINSLYTPLNIFIALVGIVVWTDYDEISLSKKGDTTLTNFLHYRREKLVKDHPNDNAQLLTREEFEGGVVGKALKGPICTFEFSGGVAMDHSNVVGLVATTIAHEMGHNFGMEHDTDTCVCPEEKCIMSPSSGNFSPTHWSSCSVQYLASAFEHGMDYCLKNKPERLFDAPVCGNGFVEPGEQCDCGLSKSCKDNYCCNPATCMLYSNATCATGECCDLKTCRPSIAGTLCRSADQECDLPEYCTGHSEFCPDDVFKMDTESCDEGKAFCYHGSCRTRSDQCQLLWGPSGESSDDKCYLMNSKGTRHGNCGYNKLKSHFTACHDDDIHCGMLHCRHFNEKLEFGMENVAILSHFFINSKGSIIPCRTAIVDLGLNQIDPGLVPDGAKCGDEKMCVNQKCLPIASLRLGAQAVIDPGRVCPSDCSGRGVCNSLGHCHCEDGFAPPLCEYPGPGGSYDSGPASDPDAYKDWVMLLCIATSGIITMTLVLAILTYYSRHQAITCWQHSKSVSSKSSTKGGLQQRGPRGGGCFGSCSPSNSIPTTLSQTTPRLSPDDMSSSLLPSQSSSNEPSIHNNLFGHFKGFSLTPLQKQEETFGVQNQNFGIENEQAKSFVSTFNGPNQGNIDSSAGNNIVKNAVNKLNNVNTNHTAQINANKSGNFHNQAQKFPIRSAPPIPSVPSVTIKLPRSNSQAIESNKQNVTLNRSSTTVGEVVDKSKSVVSGVESSNSASMAPALPPNNSISRPVISNPILEGSTCTAKELISPLKQGGNSAAMNKVPLRAAPAAPSAKSPTSNKRPLSSPDSVVNTVINVSDDQTIKKPKENTLNRIASFLKQEKNDKDKSRNPVERSDSLPKNPNHQLKTIKNIDKNTLKTLEISKPILISEIEVPAGAVPVVSDSDDLDDKSKMVIMRAQSMRGPPMPPKPNLPSFGSMRQPSGVKRPTSIPVANRPTSPPPPRPDLGNDSVKNNKKTFPKLPSFPIQHNNFNKRASDTKSPEYDDCGTEGHAPLANISEEISPDNIYAVIEESPPLITGEGLFKKPTHDASKFTHNSPGSVTSPKHPAAKLNSTSSESMGLLNEIVSEIQNRNLESIYSSSTLARKKKLEEEKLARLKNGSKEEEDVDFEDSNVYANTVQFRPNESDYSNMSGAKSTSSAASTTSSGYLNPAAVNVPVHLNLKQVTPNTNSTSLNKETINNISKSTYKPYSSSLQRSIGPFAASYLKDKSSDTTPEVSNNQIVNQFSVKSSTAEGAASFQKNNNKNQPNSLLTKSGSIENGTNGYKVPPPSGENVKDSKTLQSHLSKNQVNSPDLVSSCAPTIKSQKSPDLVNSNGNQSNTVATNRLSGVNQGVILKPSFQKPATNVNKPPILSTPKPLTKPPIKISAQDSKTIARSAPPPPNLSEKKKIVPPRPSLPKVLQQNSNGDKSGSNSSLSSSKSSSIEKNLSNISKMNSSDTDKQKGTTKSALVRKSSDNAIKTQPNPLPSKFNSNPKSNIASLQQKFEPSKINRTTTINSAKK